MKTRIADRRTYLTGAAMWAKVAQNCQGPARILAEALAEAHADGADACTIDAYVAEVEALPVD